MLWTSKKLFLICCVHNLRSQCRREIHFDEEHIEDFQRVPAFRLPSVLI